MPGLPRSNTQFGRRCGDAFSGDLLLAEEPQGEVKPSISPSQPSADARSRRAWRSVSSTASLGSVAGLMRSIGQRMQACSCWQGAAVGAVAVAEFDLAFVEAHEVWDRDIGACIVLMWTTNCVTGDSGAPWLTTMGPNDAYSATSLHGVSIAMLFARELMLVNASGPATYISDKLQAPLLLP